jgi:hypothetical protein
VQTGSHAIWEDAKRDHAIRGGAGIQLGSRRQELKTLAGWLDRVSLDFRRVVQDIDVHRAARRGVDGDDGRLDGQLRRGAEMQADAFGKVHRRGPEQLQMRAAQRHAIALDGQIGPVAVQSVGRHIHRIVDFQRGLAGRAWR